MNYSRTSKIMAVTPGEGSGPGRDPAREGIRPRRGSGPEGDPAQKGIRPRRGSGPGGDPAQEGIRPGRGSATVVQGLAMAGVPGGDPAQEGIRHRRQGLSYGRHATRGSGLERDEAARRGRKPKAEASLRHQKVDHWSTTRSATEPAQGRPLDTTWSATGPSQAWPLDTM